MTIRDIEHANNKGKGLARESSVAKRAWGPVATSWTMENRTSTDIGTPPTGRPADAVDPSLYSTQQAGKSFPTPGITRGMKSNPERGEYDPDNGVRVMNNAHAEAEPDHPVNMQKRLAASLPQATEET